jgi:hypothetical protein
MVAIGLQAIQGAVMGLLPLHDTFPVQEERGRGMSSAFYLQLSFLHRSVDELGMRVRELFQAGGEKRESPYSLTTKHNGRRYICKRFSPSPAPWEMCPYLCFHMIGYLS